MKKLLGIVVLGLIIGGLYLNDKNESLNKAKKICQDHYKTSDQKCIDGYLYYYFEVSRQIADKKWPEYKKTIQEIEKEIDELKNIKPEINLLEYSYTSAHEIENFNNNLENKKIIIGGTNASGSFFQQPGCFTWDLKSDYYVCLRQKVITESGDDKFDTTVVEISNMNNFPKIKEIIDKFNSYNFDHYKTIVYGKLTKGEKLYNKIIEADFITLERLIFDDHVYKSALNVGIGIIKKQEFLDYMKKNYPKEKKK